MYYLVNVRMALISASLMFLQITTSSLNAQSVVTNSVVQLPEYKKFIEKAASGKTMCIAYLGGSITVGGTTEPRE